MSTYCVPVLATRTWPSVGPEPAGLGVARMLVVAVRC